MPQAAFAAPAPIATDTLTVTTEPTIRPYTPPPDGAAFGQPPARRWDYLSPGLDTPPAIIEDLFPHRIAGNLDDNPWPYLRREVPHLWYVDERSPVMGFLSRDEAAILYNLARQMRGRPALEVGCWRGWSTAHLVAGGVELDVVDPVLEDEAVRGEIAASMSRLGEPGQVRLHPGPAPARLYDDEVRAHAPWSLIFIDGDHEGDAPVRDAAVCSQMAADDAIIVLHDLASPFVAGALDYLRTHGWHTLVYQTMQIMGIAWRGAAAPVPHVPDPAVDWTLPEHLRSYRVSGEPIDHYHRRMDEVLAALEPQARERVGALGALAHP